MKNNRKYRDWAHLTFAVSAIGIEVFVNIELKSATDRLKHKISHHNETFRRILVGMQLNEPLRLRIEERMQRQASVYDFNKIAEIQLSSLGQSKIGVYGFEYIEALVQTLHLPYVSIRSVIGRDKACRLSQHDQGSSLVTEVIRICKVLHEFVNFINT